jgi:hydrogenase maturation protease
MIRVLGIGNVLMGDDGFGPYVVRTLDAKYECPPGVEFVDVGTPGLDLTPYLLDADAVIVVDTVSSKGTPGAIRVYERDEILRVPPQMRTGPHDPSLKDALRRVDAAGAGPSRVLLIGVIPESVATGVSLSPPIAAAADGVVLAVVDALKVLGAPTIRRARPMVPDIWWAAPRQNNSAPSAN